MDVVADFPADPQAAEPVQASERALHAPALASEAGTVLGAAAGDYRLHAEVPDKPAVLGAVDGPRAAQDELGEQWWTSATDRPLLPVETGDSVRALSVRQRDEEEPDIWLDGYAEV
ncbi:hypothetical protein GCM10010353_70450 [Streptomyces chryseus]|nr:hypothetical protein GCM10010353_70450 [Streptomyces chryseus]